MVHFVTIEPLHGVLAVTPDEAAALLDSLSDAVFTGQLIAWAVTHARDGDPVPAAWAVCLNDSVMSELLFDCNYPRVHEVLWMSPTWWTHPGCAHFAGRHRDKTRECPDCLAEVRALTPTLTLADVMAALRAGEV